MPNGLTKHGICRTSCFYGGDNLHACSHPDYVKAINEGKRCPLDPRTELEIKNDIAERKAYFEAKKSLKENKQLLHILSYSKDERNKWKNISRIAIAEAETIIRAYESKNKS